MRERERETQRERERQRDRETERCMYVYTSIYFSLYFSYLEEYNQVTKTPMKLVMFKFAIEHVSRISRVLKQDNGHVLCIGKMYTCTLHAVNAALYIKVLEGVGVRVLLNWQHTWLVMISFKLKLRKITRQLNGGMTLKR